MIGRDQLAAQASANDARADPSLELIPGGVHARGESLESILRSFDIEPRGAVYVAEQRALRVLILQRDGPEALKHLVRGGALMPIGTTPEERARMAMYAAIWIDGLAVGAGVRGGSGG